MHICTQLLSLTPTDENVPYNCLLNWYILIFSSVGRVAISDINCVRSNDNIVSKSNNSCRAMVRETKITGEYLLLQKFRVYLKTLNDKGEV